MARVIIKVHVAYPKMLLEAFEAQASERIGSGERSSIVCFDPEHPNVTVFILEWESVESANRFWSGAVAAKQMKSWRAVDSPTISVLDEFTRR